MSRTNAFATILAIGLAAGLAAAPAAAATTASAGGSASLSIVGVTGDVLISPFAPLVDFDAFETGNAKAIANAAGAVSAAGDAISMSSTLFVRSGAPFADAFAFGDVIDGGFLLENLGDTAASVTFSVDYDFSVAAFATTPLNDAFGVVDFDITSDILGEVLAISLLADVGFGLADDAASAQGFVFTVNLDAFGFDNISSSLASTASATSFVAPVPLPAAAWMLLASLGGLVAMRRRA